MTASSSADSTMRASTRRRALTPSSIWTQASPASPRQPAPSEVHGRRAIRAPEALGQSPARWASVVVHDRDMTLEVSDEERVHEYFASLDRHVERWRQTGGRWSPFAGEVPIDSMQAAALRHESAKVRRHALGVLDHAANDASTATFRAALVDPVPKVRLVALHGLACERCRTGDVCVDDVVRDVLRTLRDDASPTVRHAAIDVLARFISRDERIVPALLERAAMDSDDLVRLTAARAAAGERKVWTRKAVRRRRRTAARRAGHEPTLPGSPAAST